MGFMGAMHAQIYAQLRAATLVAVVDKQKVKAQRDLAKLKLNAPVFGTLEELLRAQAVDVVDICLPTDLHAPIALKAIAASKHVFSPEITTGDEAADSLATTLAEIQSAATDRTIDLAHE
jgi:predicted dehydrogenase